MTLIEAAIETNTDITGRTAPVPAKTKAEIFQEDFSALRERLWSITSDAPTVMSEMTRLVTKPSCPESCRRSFAVEAFDDFTQVATAQFVSLDDRRCAIQEMAKLATSPTIIKATKGVFVQKTVDALEAFASDPSLADAAESGLDQLATNPETLIYLDAGFLLERSPFTGTSSDDLRDHMMRITELAADPAVIKKTQGRFIPKAALLLQQTTTDPVLAETAYHCIDSLAHNLETVIYFEASFLADQTGLLKRSDNVSDRIDFAETNIKCRALAAWLDANRENDDQTRYMAWTVEMLRDHNRLKTETAESAMDADGALYRALQRVVESHETRCSITKGTSQFTHFAFDPHKPDLLQLPRNFWGAPRPSRPRC